MLKFPERKYPHPGFPNDAVTLKLWEIRNQLEINIESMIMNAPVNAESMKFFGHPIEMATSHVFDRLNELENLIKTGEE